MVCSIPATVLWPSRILELIVLLCTAQLPTYPAVFLDHHQELIGTFLMEVRLNVLVPYHTIEVGLMHSCLPMEQYFFIVTLGLPQQESSTVRYVMPLEFFRASMWGYILPLQVSPVHWREINFYSKNLWLQHNYITRAENLQTHRGSSLWRSLHEWE